MDLMKSIMISAAGIRAQSFRIRIISENIANANSTAASADEDPYRRKVLSFRNEIDRELGVDLVKINKVGRDMGKFGRRFDPGNPAADADGYIRTPNVNTLIETMDMRQALRAYEANLNAIKASKQMMMRTLELLRN